MPVEDLGRFLVGWLAAGAAGAGDERTGVRACAVALTGPNPLGGPADMVVVAEEPGIGLGAALAGLDSVDPGAGFGSAPPIAIASFGKHDFPLWQVDSPGRAVFAGEVQGRWLWVVLLPDTAGTLLVEPLALRDLRDPGQHLTFPSGPPRRACPLLNAAPLMRADLHVHSTASDGTDPPAEVMRAPPGRPRRGGADRSRHGGRRRRGPCRGGPVTLLPGMELSCRLDGRSLHMLAYLFDADQPELAAELTRIRDDRVLRAGPWWTSSPVSAWTSAGSRSRPSRDRPWSAGRTSPARWRTAAHRLAREAFTRDWIADGGRAYVGRYALDPARAIDLVRAAGGVTALAHPRAGRDTWVTNEQIARLAAVGLAGLEVFHPDQSEAERARLIALAHDLALVPTGGSDDHGSLTDYRLGGETTSGEAYQDLLSRVPRPA